MRDSEAKQLIQEMAKDLYDDIADTLEHNLPDDDLMTAAEAADIANRTATTFAQAMREHFNIEPDPKLPYNPPPGTTD